MTPRSIMALVLLALGMYMLMGSEIFVNPRTVFFNSSEAVAAKYSSSTSLVDYLIERERGGYIVAAPNVNTKRQIINFASTDHFSNRMRGSGISCFAWIDPLKEMQADLSWVQRTSSWWKERRNYAVSHATIADLRTNSRPVYRALADEFASGNFAQSAKNLSPYPNGVDAWPSVALIENATILSEGQIINGSLTLHGKGCGSATSLVRSEVGPRFQIVATIAHFLGEHYFHFVAENLARLPLVLPIIEHFPKSMVHIRTQSPFVISLLGILGVATNRIIQGTVHAEVALLPEPTPCGSPPAILLHLLRRTLLQKSTNFGHDDVETSRACIILVVRRDASRKVSNHKDLVSKLSRNFRHCTMKEHTGKERAIDQLKMFRAASVVVAPHGAGLANIIACRESTLVLEFLVAGQDINICYMAMALKLHLNYVSLTVAGSSQYGAMTVNIGNTISHLKRFIKGVNVTGIQEK